jgi:hypothetical protein
MSAYRFAGSRIADEDRDERPSRWNLLLGPERRR